MITLLTGTPGAGKTSWLISYLIEEIKKGRKIYVDNIPELVLDVKKAGPIDKWQEGSWLGIDTYSPIDGDPDSNWEDNGNGRPDAGALIVSDECQRWFRPRGGRSVPPHVSALEVHRHQGLDFLFITQNIKLIDSNVIVLVSKHIHIRLTPFGRKIYEWPEVSNPNSKQQRNAAAQSSYKPDPKVFALYKSASVHTKLKHKMPNALAMVLLCLFGFSVLGYFAYDKIFAKTFSGGSEIASVSPARSASPVHPDKQFQSQKVAYSPQRPPLAVATKERTRAPDVAGCFASFKGCHCFDGSGSDVGFTNQQCLDHLHISILPSSAGASGITVFKQKKFPSARERFWAFREREFRRLHPYRDFKPEVHGADGWTHG